MNPRKKRTQKKRDLPQLRYTIRRFSDYQSITDNKRTKNFLFINLLPAITDGISSNLNEVPIVQLEDSKTSVMLKKADWKASLTKAIEFYSTLEHYEQCQKFKELLEKI
jgi:hypothetical protein